MKRSGGITKAVVVGYGHFGKKRIESVISLKNKFRLVGIVESDEKRRVAAQKAYGVPTSHSMKPLARHADLAIIATPNHTHVGLVKEAIGLGLHVLCEKPLARTSKEADIILGLAESSKITVKTGSNHRFIPNVEKLLDVVSENRLGTILRISISIGNNGAHVRGKWFWDKQRSGGGTLIDNGCHAIDLVNHVLPDITSCASHTATLFWKKASVEDTGTVCFVTDKGTEALISTSWMKWYGYLKIEVWGTRGYAATEDSDNSLTIYDTRGRRVRRYVYGQEKLTSYAKELVYMKQCIDTDIQPAPSAADGARVMRMIEAAYAASRSRKWVRIRQ